MTTCCPWEGTSWCCHLRPLQSPHTRQWLLAKPSGEQRVVLLTGQQPTRLCYGKASSASGCPVRQCHLTWCSSYYLLPVDQALGEEQCPPLFGVGFSCTPKTDPWHPNCSRVREAKSLFVLLLPLLLQGLSKRLVVGSGLGKPFHRQISRSAARLWSSGSLPLPRQRSWLPCSASASTEMDPIPDARAAIQKTCRVVQHPNTFLDSTTLMLISYNS